MVQIMAEENHDWSQSPAMMNQTVEAIKKFLDMELGKYETLKMANASISHLFDNEKAFANAKRKDTNGVGRETILKFLGGNWK